MQVRRNPRNPLLPSDPRIGELTVALGDRIVGLEPICVLMVNFAAEWIDLATLIGLTTDVVDPDGDQREAEEFVRAKLLGLVTLGVLELRDHAEVGDPLNPAG